MVSSLAILQAEFGFPDSVIPIFVSFHLNKPSLLNDNVVTYLKTHEPIGCRDWTTVYMLKSKGIKAFFSGCLTMTIGDLFVASANNNNGENRNSFAYVEASGDLGEIDPSSSFVQVSPAVKSATLEKSLEDAFSFLHNYRNYNKGHLEKSQDRLIATEFELY